MKGGSGRGLKKKNSCTADPYPGTFPLQISPPFKFPPFTLLGPYIDEAQRCSRTLHLCNLHPQLKSENKPCAAMMPKI